MHDNFSSLLDETGTKVRTEIYQFITNINHINNVEVSQYFYFLIFLIHIGSKNNINKIQTHKRFKRTLFIRTRQNQQIY